MSPLEATTSIIIAMINNNSIATAEQVSEAYKTIYSTVIKPQNY